jgi:hypothetical protein
MVHYHSRLIQLSLRQQFCQRQDLPRHRQAPRDLYRLLRRRITMDRLKLQFLMRCTPRHMHNFHQLLNPPKRLPQLWRQDKLFRHMTPARPTVQARHMRKLDMDHLYSQLRQGRWSSQEIGKPKFFFQSTATAFGDFPPCC